MRGLFASIAEMLRAERKPLSRWRSARLTIEELEDRSVPSGSPTLLTPTGATSTDPTSTWSSVTGATSYDIWVTDQTLGTTVYSQSNITQTSFTLPAPAEPLNQTDVFAWTARADNGNGAMGPFSTPLTFTAGVNLQNPNWLTEVGSYTFSNNQTTGVGHSTLNTAVLAGVNIADVSVQASVAFTATGQYAGLVTRYGGPGDTNMYLGVLIDTGNGTLDATILRNVKGVWTQVSTGETVTGSGGALVFQAQGADLKLFLNGTLVAYAHDSTLTGGTVGIRSTAGVTVSNFAASQANLTNASLPFNDDFTTTSFGNQLSTSWLEQAGNFNLATGAAVSQGAAMGIATVNGIDATDVNLQANISFTAAGQYAGLVARYSGAGNGSFYFGRLTYLGNGAVNAVILLNLNGVWMQVGSGENFAYTGGTLDFQVQGSNLTLYLNGTEVAFGQNSNLTAGAVGIGALRAPISNFQSSVAVPSSSTWVQRAGVLNVATGTVYTAAGSGGIATAVGSSAADVSVQGTVSFTAAGQYAGLVARYSGPADSNFYYGRLTYLGNGMAIASILRNSNGVWVQIGASKTIAVTSAALIFQVEGSDLKLFVNGSLVSYGQDTVLSSGAVGIQAFGGASVAAFQFAAPILTASPPPFSDNFGTPSQGNQLSYSWEEQAGNFNLATGAAVAQNSVNNLATVNGSSETNADLQTVAALSATDQYAGLVARYTNSNNYYFAFVMSLGNGKYEAAIYRSYNGVWAELTATTLSHFNGALQFQVTGSHLTLTVDGVPTLSAIDGLLTGPGLVGIRGGMGASFSSFAAS